MDTIVVGVDGSDGALGALRWAAAEARRRGARLHVVAAWQPSAVSSLPAWGVAEPTDEILAELRRGLDATLDAEGLGPGTDLDVSTSVVAGHPATALLDASTDASVLVVGQRGLGGFAGLVLGSVSHHVATHARCAVVVVPTRP